MLEKTQVEKTTLTSVNYVYKFSHDLSNKRTLFQRIADSPNEGRNQFNTEGETQDFSLFF